MRRFTRLTNAFSKKLENHCHALALYFMFYNFCRVHKTLGATPAMAAGLIDRVMKMADFEAALGSKDHQVIFNPLISISVFPGAQPTKRVLIRDDGAMAIRNDLPRRHERS
jgi:hypothetical protein